MVWWGMHNGSTLSTFIFGLFWHSGPKSYFPEQFYNGQICMEGFVQIKRFCQNVIEFKLIYPYIGWYDHRLIQRVPNLFSLRTHYFTLDFWFIDIAYIKYITSLILFNLRDLGICCFEAHFL